MLSALFADIALFPYEPPWLTVTVLIVFLFLLGGAIGSFLNVVIYRVPAGLSIVSPRSRCPRCLTPILARDNVPVVGWLMLRGRCRFCQAPIAARYPLVEAAAGVAFTLLCLGEAVFPGLTLPIPSATADQHPLFGLAMYHFALLCGLGAAALMTYDGGVVPVAFWRVILLIGLLPPLVWPDLRPIPFHTAAPAYGRLAAGIADGAAGALFGALAGMAAWPVAVIGARARSGHLNSVAALSAVGAYLGWQAAAAVALATAVLVLLREPLRRVEVAGRFPWLGFVFVAALALLLGWRYLAAHLVVGETLLLGPAAPAWFAAAAVVGTLALSLLSRRLHLPLAERGVADARRAPSAPTH